jgi:hypothetical protein
MAANEADRQQALIVCADQPRKLESFPGLTAGLEAAIAPSFGRPPVLGGLYPHAQTPRVLPRPLPRSACWNPGAPPCADATPRTSRETPCARVDSNHHGREAHEALNLGHPRKMLPGG